MILSKCYQHITNKQNLKVDIRVRQRIRFNFVGVCLCDFRDLNRFYNV